MTADRLERDFFARPTLIVARDLLGRRLVRMLERPPSAAYSAHDPGAGNPVGQDSLCHRLSGHIAEVEAYTGSDDAASHASRGRTPRNAAMFDKPGHAYVYFIYGMHWMFNVVARTDGPGAVLVRALIPDDGLSIMRQHCGGRPDAQLTSGPARLAQALAIDGALNGVDLCTSAEIFIEAGTSVPDGLVARGPRVGVSGDALALTRPWRFWIIDAP